MFGLPTFRIGRLFGIPVEVNASWLFIFALVAASLSLEAFPVLFPDRSWAVNAISGVVTAGLFFASVVAHETSHSLVARAGGARIRKITLFIFGGVAQMEEEPDSPGREFLMAVAGPGMSLAVAVACGAVVLLAVLAGLSDVWWAPFEFLAFMNLALAVFNLLPGFPLDGGRVLRAGLWWLSGDLLRATRWAAGAGRGLGILMAAVGIYGAAAPAFGLPGGQRDPVGSLWLVVLGWFLATMAGRAYQDQRTRAVLARIPVRQVMEAPAPVLDADASVEAAERARAFGPRPPAYALVREGSVVGVLSADALRTVPTDARASTPVWEVGETDLAERVVRADDGLDTAASRIGGEGAGPLVVVDGGRLVGILTRTGIVGAVRHSRSRGRPLDVSRRSD